MARSPTAWTRSRRCSSSPTPTRTRSGPTVAPPRRSAARRSRSSSWCGPGGCASCAGSARGSRRGCASWSRPGEIAELAELERELAPDLVGLGRYLGLGAKRSVEIARSLGVRTADELREAAAAGRLRTVPGIGPKTEARLLEALAREGEPRPQRGLLLNRAWELVGGVAAALEGEPAGDVRRWRDSCELLSVVCATRDPGSVLARFAALPQIVAVVEQERAARGGGDRRGRADRAGRRRA